MKVKVCGLTSPKEAQYLNENEVEYAGMVMNYPKSKRNITPQRAEEILEKLDPEILSVAVMVEPTKEQIKQADVLGFDYVQIHGELPVEWLTEVSIPILKAFNVKDLEQYETYSKYPQIAGYVFDAQEPGSGKTFDWKLVQDIPRDDKLLLVAGGLNPENVQDVISQLHPDGVDVSSGVELADGTGKDPAKIQLFVHNVRNA